MNREMDKQNGYSFTGTVIKMNEVWVQVTTCMNFENILCKIIQQ